MIASKDKFSPLSILTKRIQKGITGDSLGEKFFPLSILLKRIQKGITSSLKTQYFIFYNVFFF